MKTILKAGFGVGILSGLAAICVFYALTAWLDESFTKLNPFSILTASIAANLAGAFIYTKLLEHSSKPALYYAAITIMIALVLSFYDWAFPAEPNITGIANTLHALVATLSIAWMPGWVKRIKPDYC